MANLTNTSLATPERDSAWWFGQTFPIIIILIGVVGNSIIISILSKKNYLETSTCYYMKALAWSDNFVMFLLFIRWLSHIPNSPIARNTYFCVLYFFSVRLGLGISAWALMFMTIDRYIAIRFPLKAKSLCTIFRARLTLFIIALVHIISHLPYFWRYSNPNALTLSEQCPYAIPSEFAKVYQILRMIVFDRLLPWVVTLSFTIAMTAELYGDMKRKLSVFNVTTNRKFSRRVTIMSLSVAWMFFLLTFPTTIYELIRVVEKLSMPRFLYDLFVYLLYLNSAINFYLYMIVARRFREEFKCIILKLLGRPVPQRYGLSASSSPNSIYSLRSATIAVAATDLPRKNTVVEQIENADTSNKAMEVQ